MKWLQRLHKGWYSTKIFSGYRTISTECRSQFEKMLECMQPIPCTLIPGDGVGPELVQSLEEIFKVAKVPICFEYCFLSEISKDSDTLEDVAASVRKNKICVKGVIATPDLSGIGELQTLNMKFRRHLDLYANIVHARCLPGICTRHKDIDLVIIREQTEGEYSALEHEAVPGVVECLKVITARKSRRIAKFAFDFAKKNGRKKVTIVHKANIMKYTDGTFMRTCQAVGKLYPDIEKENVIVDACVMQLVSQPQAFDVLVTPNLYGNIIANLCAGLVGGAGVVGSASYGNNLAVFEPGARHIYAVAEGKNIANPLAMIRCGTKLLRYIKLDQLADEIDQAVFKVLEEGKVRTEDIGGQATTMEFTCAICEKIESSRCG